MLYILYLFCSVVCVCLCMRVYSMRRRRVLVWMCVCICMQGWICECALYMDASSSVSSMAVCVCVCFSLTSSIAPKIKKQILAILCCYLAGWTQRDEAFITAPPLVNPWSMNKLRVGTIYIYLIYIYIKMPRKRVGGGAKYFLSINPCRSEMRRKPVANATRKMVSYSVTLRVYVHWKWGSVCIAYGARRGLRAARHSFEAGFRVRGGWMDETRTEQEERKRDLSRNERNDGFTFCFALLRTKPNVKCQIWLSSLSRLSLFYWKDGKCHHDYF